MVSVVHSDCTGSIDGWFICTYSPPLPGWRHACAGLWVSLIGGGSKNDLLCKRPLKCSKQWLKARCARVRARVYWSWNRFCWGGGQLSGSYQGASRRGMVSSHFWAINVRLIAFHRGKKRGAGCNLFHFLYAKLQHGATSMLQLSTYACNPSFSCFSYLFKQCEQMGMTNSYQPHYTDVREERGGKDR